METVRKYNVIKYLYDKIIGPEKIKVHNLQYWRQQIFAALSITIILIGFFALIISVLACIPEGFVFIAVFDILAYISVIFVLFNSRISRGFKIYFLGFIFYIIGVVLLLTLGKIGAGYAWLFSFPIVIGILKGLKPGFYAIIINTITLLLIGVFLIQLRFFSRLPIAEYDLLAWITVSVNFILLNALVTIVISVLLRGLKVSMQEQNNLSARLINKKELLQKSNLKLHKEIKKGIEIEAELREAVTKAKSASIAKSEFLSNISHEIRTPLNAMIGFSDLLTDCDDKALSAEYVKSIQHAGRELLFLFDKILDLSKIESEKMTIKKDVADIEKIFYDLKIIYEKQIADKGLRPNFIFHNHSSDFLMLDEIRIKQILMNLIDNAIKFTKTGGIKVIFEIDEGNQQNRANLKISVEDTGIGIPEADFDNIFDSFWQIDGKSTREFEGTGLGLSLVKKLLHLMKGEIRLESTVGKGSTFTIILNNIDIPSREILETKNISKYYHEPSQITNSDHDIETKQKDRKFIKTLQNTYLPQLEDLEENMIVNDILQFAHQLHDFGNKHKSKPITDLSKKLISCSLIYDIEKIMTVLKELKSSFQQL